jgi:hypothetical protein
MVLVPVVMVGALPHPALFALAAMSVRVARPRMRELRRCIFKSYMCRNVPGAGRLWNRERLFYMYYRDPKSFNGQTLSASNL